MERNTAKSGVSHKVASQRQLRVGEEIRHALSSIFLQGTLYEPELIGISITVPEVRVSPDLRNATAFVFPLAGRAPEGFIATLNRIAPTINYMVAQHVKLRFAPKVIFKIDNSFDVANKIENLLEATRTYKMNKSKNNVNGWLVINKPVGVSSTRVVAIVKRFYNAKKVGHAGTLDPLANGVLPIALGEATKTINFCMDSEKEYQFTVKWCEETSTCDMEGEVVATSEKIPTLDEIKETLPQFIGEIEQVPPAYSAIKINGKRAYDLARSGQEVKMKARKVVVYELEVLESGIGNRESVLCTFRVKCGKGTYVRSLARDIAERMGTKGHVTELIRTKVGKFCIDNAILLEKLENTVYNLESPRLLLPVEEVLDDIPVLSFNFEDAKAIRQGKQVAVLEASLNNGQITAIKAENVLLAIGEFYGGFIKPVRVFNI